MLHEILKESDVTRINRIHVNSVESYDVQKEFKFVKSEIRVCSIIHILKREKLSKVLLREIRDNPRIKGQNGQYGNFVCSGIAYCTYTVLQTLDLGS